MSYNFLGLCVRWRLKPLKFNLKTKVDMSTNDKLKNKTANGTKPVLCADWRSVKDELPLIVSNSNGGCSEEVLVWINSQNRIEYKEQRQIAYYTNDGWCYQYGELMHNEDMEGVTHWMTLPSPPICT